jgi:hypothetical protein
MTLAKLGAVLRAARDFLRGFVGASRLASDPESVRRALAERAERRRGCC